MRKLVSSDERFIPAPIDRVYAALVDFDAYRHFWPSDAGFEVERVAPGYVGSTAVCVLPKGRGRFRWKLARCEELASVHIDHDGLFRGPGVYTLRTDGVGTRVRFDVDLEIVPLPVRILSYVINVNRAHSAFMENVFDGLVRYTSAPR